MKRTYTRLLLFLVPFILNAFIILVVDPYNILNTGLIPKETKYRCIGRSGASLPRGQVPYKMAQFDRSPIQNVIFGDSRMTHLNCKYFVKKQKEGIYNFAIAGGNVQTAIDFFWFCAEKIKLKRVFFQIEFMNFSDAVNYDLVKPYRDYKESIFKYLISKSASIDTYALIYYLISANDRFVDICYHERNIDTWKRSYDGFEKKLSIYKYPKIYLSEFNKIKNFCLEQNIDIYFIILPNYITYYDVIRKHEMVDDYNTFISNINRLGTLLEPVSLGGFTKDKNNYRDIFHYCAHRFDSISNEIWKQYFRIVNDLSLDVAKR